MIGRLVHSLDFQRVLATAPKARSAHFAAHHVAGGPTRVGVRAEAAGATKLSTGDAPVAPALVDKPVAEGAWLGLVVPKRLARRSVTRQLLKRQMRDAVRRHVEGLPSGLWVLRLRQGFDKARYVSAASAQLRRDVRAELDVLLAGAVRR